MKALFKLLLLLFIVNFLSCDNEIIKTDLNDSELEKEFFTSVFIYEDQKYVVPCELVGDSIIFLNEEFKALYDNEISKHPNLATCIREDGAIEYFSNNEKMRMAYNLPMLNLDAIRKEYSENNNIMTKARLVDIGQDHIRLYDDKNFKDRNYGWVLDHANDYVAIAHLKPIYGFNDKTSSIKIGIPSSTVMLYAWENDNYKGRSFHVGFYGYNSPSGPADNIHGFKGDLPNLKQIPCGSGNWNDRITSIIICHRDNPPSVFPIQTF